MGSFQSDDPNGGAFGTGYSDPIGGLGEHSYDPETGEQNSAIGKLWGGITGKRGPTAPRLPKGFEWMGPLAQALAGGALQNVDYTGANAAQQAGILGSGATAGATAGTFPGSLSAFNAGLGGLGEGVATGFLPDLNQLDALLRPGVDRSFQSGAADIREQNALTGNLSSTGASQQIGDFRAQLENDLNRNVAGIYGSALPTAMNTRADLTRTGLQLPGFNTQSIYNPAAASGSQGMQNILGAIQTAMSGVSGAPFFANQGSSGNGSAGAIGSALVTGGK